MFRLRGWFILTICASATAWMFAAIPERGIGQVKYAAGLPDEPGLAAKYPGDTGIERDPSVIFVEKFDESSLDEMKKRWESVSNGEIMSFSNDAIGD